MAVRVNTCNSQPQCKWWIGMVACLHTREVGGDKESDQETVLAC